MLELILKIREHTEAGSILEHMELFDGLEEEVKKQEDYRCPSQITDDIMGINPEFGKLYDKIMNKPIAQESKNKTYRTILDSMEINQEVPGVEAVKKLYDDICKTYDNKKESCDNCIYWMDDFCSNEVVCDIFSDIDIKCNWCDQWRSEDEVVRDEDA